MSPGTDDVAPRHPVRSTSLIVGGHASTMFLVFGFALYLPLIRDDFDLSFSRAGSLAVATTVVYAMMQIPAGYLADRFGARRLFALGILTNHLLAVMLAFIDVYWVLFGHQALMGLARSLVFTPGLVLVAAQFGRGRRATSMGVYSGGAFAASMVLNLVGPVLVEPLGWRLMFVIFAAVGIVTCALFWKLSDPDPVAVGGVPSVSLAELTPLLHQPVLWLAGGVQFVRLAVVTGMAFWLPSLLVSDKGFDLRTTGFVIAFGAFIAAPANIFGGWISDRLDRPTLVIAISLAILSASTALLATAQQVVVVLAVVAVQSLFIQIYFGPLFAVPVRVFGPRTAGTTNGFSNFCANLGALVAAYGLGAVRDATGSFTPALYALSGLCVVGLALTAALHRASGRTPRGLPA